MSYSQEIYDAVRSRISGGDVGSVVRDVASQAFDISFVRDAIQQEACAAAYQWQRPSAVFRPTLSADGDQWSALLGENLQEGVAGFGPTPEAAMAAFDAAFWNEKTPAAKLRDSGRLPKGEDPSGAECEASQSGPKGIAHPPHPQPQDNPNAS